MMREVLGVHTCDRRSTRTSIAHRYPGFPFEEGFSEEDPLWLANLRESDSQLDHRVKGFLDDIFAHDSNTFISLTSHSGAIAGFLRVLGHEPFRLPTGGVIPVLVKGEKKLGFPPPVKIEPGFPPPACNPDQVRQAGE
jgi:broad specificity phosphatase PhoE